MATTDELYQRLQQHPNWRNLTAEGKEAAAKQFLSRLPEYKAAKGPERRALIEQYVIPHRGQRAPKQGAANAAASYVGNEFMQGVGANLTGALTGVETDMPGPIEAMQGLYSQGARNLLPGSMGEAAKTVGGAAARSAGMLADPAGLALGGSVGALAGRAASAAGAGQVARAVVGGMSGGAAVGGAIPAAHGGGALDIAQGAALGAGLGAAGGRIAAGGPSRVLWGGPAAPPAPGMRPGGINPMPSAPGGPRRLPVQAMPGTTEAIVNQMAPPPGGAAATIVNRMAPFQGAQQRGPMGVNLLTALGREVPSSTPPVGRNLMDVLGRTQPTGSVAALINQQATPKAPSWLTPEMAAGLEAGTIPDPAAFMARMQSLARLQAQGLTGTRINQMAPPPGGAASSLVNAMRAERPPLAEIATAPDVPPVTPPAPMPAPAGASTWRPPAGYQPPTPDLAAMAREFPLPAPRGLAAQMLGAPARAPRAQRLFERADKRPNYIDLEPPWWNGHPQGWQALPHEMKAAIWADPTGAAEHMGYPEMEAFKGAIARDTAREEAFGIPKGLPPKPLQRLPQSPMMPKGQISASQPTQSRPLPASPTSIMNPRGAITINPQAAQKLMAKGQKYATELGAFKQVPAYENHKRAKNWLAVVSQDPRSPGGISRSFQERAKGDYYYMAGGLEPGMVVEFGADYLSGGGRRSQRRVYGVVTAVEPDGVTIEKFPSSQEAFQAAKGAPPKGNAPADVPSLQEFARKIKPEFIKLDRTHPNSAEPLGDIVYAIETGKLTAEDVANGALTKMLGRLKGSVLGDRVQEFEASVKRAYEGKSPKGSAPEAPAPAGATKPNAFDVYLKETPPLSEAEKALVSMPVEGAKSPKKSGEVETFTPSEIKVSAKDYQFKDAGDSHGVTDRLRDVAEWDQAQADRRPLIVHVRDLSEGGAPYVVDGHQRTGLAKRMAEEGQNPVLRGMVYRESDGFDVPTMRRIGAMANIQDGTGTAVDVAKVIRVAPLSKAESARLPRGSNRALRDGEAIATLPEEAFDLVVNGKLSRDPELNAELAAIVAREVKNPGAQLEVLRDFVRKTPESRAEAIEIAREFERAGTSTVTQNTLFGTSEKVESYARPMGEIVRALKSELANEKNALASAARNKARLENKGTTVNAEAAKAGADEARMLAAFVDQETRLEGPVRDALKLAAKEYHSGNISRAEAARRTLEALVEGTPIGRAAKASGSGAGHVPGQGAIFGPEGLISGESGQATPATAATLAGVAAGGAAAAAGHPILGAIMAGGSALANPAVRRFIYDPSRATNIPNAVTHPLEVAGAAVKAGWLGNPATLARNEVGNVLEAAFTGATRPASALVDSIIGAMTGERTVQGFSPASVARSMRESIRHWGPDMAAIMSGNPRTPQQIAAYGAWVDRPVRTRSQLLDAAINGTFRLQSAADVPARRYAFHRSIDEQATLMARAWGRQNRQPAAAVRAYRDNLIANPTQNMEFQAANDASYATFQNDTTLGRVTEGARALMRDEGPAGAFAADATIPFAKTPASVTTRIAQTMLPTAPAMTVRAISRAMRRTFTTEDQRLLAQAWGRNLGGWALMYLGYKYGSDWLTNVYHQENAPLDSAEGRQAGSMRIGDRWVRISNLGPVGVMPILGEAIRESRMEATTGKKMGKAIASGIKVLADNPLVSFAEDMTKLIHEEGWYDKAGMAAGKYASSFVPSMVNQLGQMTDTQERQTDPERPLSYLQAKIPGLRQGLPAKVTGAGEDARQTYFGTRATDTVATRELRRLGIPLQHMEKTLDVGKRPSGERFMLKLPMKMRQDLYAIQQDVTLKALEAVVQSDEYRALGDDERAAMARKTMAAVRRKVVAAFKNASSEDLTKAIMKRLDEEAYSPPERTAP